MDRSDKIKRQKYDLRSSSPGNEPIIDEYLDTAPGPSRPRKLPTSTPDRRIPSDPVSKFFKSGAGVVQLGSLNDEDLMSLAAAVAAQHEEFSDEEEISGSEDEGDVGGTEGQPLDLGETHSDLFLVKQVRPLSPPASSAQPDCPSPDPILPEPFEEPPPTSPARGSSPPLLLPSGAFVPRLPARPSTNWHPEPVQPPCFPFVESPGLKVVMDNHQPWDYFKLFFTDDFLGRIVSETNRNALNIFLNSEAPRARISEWKELTLGEFLIFLGLLFHMGNVVLSSIRDYWRTDRFYNLPFWACNMSRDRFEIILRALHFNAQYPSSTEPPDDPSNDRLYKLRPVLDHFNRLMENIYSPHRELSIDESMILWRGRLAFRQYIKTKRHKYGIKLYILAENTGLVHRLIIYTGKADKARPSEGSHARCVVSTLLNKISRTGHALYMDNFFTSLDIVSHLLRQSMYCTATLRVNRVGNPKEVINTCLKRSEVVQRWNDEGICVLKWKDERDVLMISSEHTGNLQSIRNRRGQPVQKPEACVHYNKYMGGIDRMDQLLSYSLINRKTIRWYKKTAIHIFQIMLQNSFLVYKENPAGLSTKLLSKDFRLDIIGNLVDNGRRMMTRDTQIPPAVQPRRRATHYPELLPYRDEASKRRKQQDCKVCSTKTNRKRVSHFCPLCPDQPALCVPECFKLHHQM